MLSGGHRHTESAHRPVLCLSIAVSFSPILNLFHYLINCLAMNLWIFCNFFLFLLCGKSQRHATMQQSASFCDHTHICMCKNGRPLSFGSVFASSPFCNMTPRPRLKVRFYCCFADAGCEVIKADIVTLNHGRQHKHNDTTGMLHCN